VDDKRISSRLGTVTLEPDGAVTAGSVGQWILTYTVGSYGVDDGGTIKLSQRFASDWQVPQFSEPDQPGYTTVRTSGNASLHPYYDRKAHERPWMKCLVIDVYDGYLKPGDEVIITLGDQSYGSPGIRAQTFQESAHEFRLLVDPTNACVARRLPSSPTFPVVPAAPQRLICTVPTQAEVGEPVPVRVRGEDRWGNPTPPPPGLRLTWEGDREALLQDSTLIMTEPGTGWVVVEADGGDQTLSGRSNPLTAREPPRARRKYWGDLHAQSDATVGTGTEDEYFSFARDWAWMDFVSHQGNDFQVTDEDWSRLNAVTHHHHQDGSFVVFPGYEWSANTPAGGDRNVIYGRDGLPIFRSSHWQIPSVPEDDLSPAHPADELFARLHQHVETDDVVLMSHVGGRFADIRRFFDEELGPLLEIASCWGVFEWLLWDALEMGYVVGVVCNSDGHKGRPGAEAPGAGEFGMAGGLTCVVAPELTREAILEALRERRCYGTTGPRMDLDVHMDRHPLGTVLPWKEARTVEAALAGTAPVESLTLYQARVPVCQVRPAAFEDVTGSRRLRISWRGSRLRGRGRRVTWDGTIRLTDAQLREAETFAFDAVGDGILHQDAHQIVLRSSTTGDTDGIDLWLDRGRQGEIVFDSEAGRFAVELAQLDKRGGSVSFDLGGMGMEVRIERYPEQLTEYRARLAYEVLPQPDALSPYWIKGVQSDGHMVWSSPIYVRPRSED